MNLKTLILEDLVFLNREFKTSNDFFEFINKEVENERKVLQGFLSAIVNREQEYPTGLQLEGYGVAIPHTDPEFIKEEFISLTTLKKPIFFEPMDGSDGKVSVNLILLLGLKSAEDQLSILQEIMALIQDKNKISRILTSTNVSEVIQEF